MVEQAPHLASEHRSRDYRPERSEEAGILGDAFGGCSLPARPGTFRALTSQAHSGSPIGVASVSGASATPDGPEGRLLPGPPAAPPSCLTPAASEGSLQVSLLTGGRPGSCYGQPRWAVHTASPPSSRPAGCPAVTTRRETEAQRAGSAGKWRSGSRVTPQGRDARLGGALRGSLSPHSWAPARPGHRAGLRADFRGLPPAGIGDRLRGSQPRAAEEAAGRTLPLCFGGSPALPSTHLCMCWRRDATGTRRSSRRRRSDLIPNILASHHHLLYNWRLRLYSLFVITD